MQGWVSTDYKNTKKKYLFWRKKLIVKKLPVISWVNKKAFIPQLWTWRQPWAPPTIPQSHQVRSQIIQARKSQSQGRGRARGNPNLITYFDSGMMQNDITGGHDQHQWTSGRVKYQYLRTAILLCNVCMILGEMGSIWLCKPPRI